MNRSKIALAVLVFTFALGQVHAATTAQDTTIPKGLNQANRDDAAFDFQTRQLLTAMWRVDPDGALYAGRFEGAAQLHVPNAAARDRQRAFNLKWLQTFEAMDATKLSTRQRTDHALVLDKLKSDHWYLETFREFEWNPADYSIGSGIDRILTTHYAPQPQRLRTLLQRIAKVPAYYQAAQANISNPTPEHTQLAILRAPGNLSILDDLLAAAQASRLTAKEKALFQARVDAAKVAVNGYLTFLKNLDQALASSGQVRSFRIGKELYEAKFALDIQSSSTAEQTYQNALAAREQLLANMNTLANTLWPKVMDSMPMPDDRNQKIGLVIDKLSDNHVAAQDFFTEVRRQIPVLNAWVVDHDLVSMDPKKPLVVRETPVYARGVAGAGIEAPGPYRPQDRTYYNVTPFDTASPQQIESQLREYNHWMLQILNIHEAIPGHYTQLVHANKSPSIVKSLFGNGAMVEGWAVYGERMMLESGYGNHAPEMWLMYSKWNLRSVTNTILDYSVHVLGMSREEALDLLMRQAFQTEREATEKWRRVQLTSVQLTSYFSGFSEIMKLRDQQRAKLGDKFKLKAFHDKFLSYGSAPVRIISDLMQ